MATPGGAGSHLASLAARRQSLQKARERLSLAPSGGVANARPQAQVEAPAPPPPAPSSPPVQASSPSRQAPAAQPGAGTSRDPQMLAQAQSFIQQVQAQGQEVTNAPKGPLTAPPAVPAPLTEQINNYGAAGMSPYAQAQRLFGRNPSAREFYIFSATKSLEAQLGRPPTRNEVLMHVTAPGGSNRAGPEPVV